ncbi:tRNA epoxyqueuosine(34) reductase QueG [Tepidibacter formicigenes]|jgi:epoxyqueuosine reductase|uniref:Epoxyqueuosine reductase n=1 Tax=Tepidibacter formicigenes DSM 15518 TaxID=1123349 RepID=A0A1M6N476_9FIRM|nr:tRNA epoxyqueuosine(34) reductase QueG [Tepidibacter formicigenes]SHJ90490.1 epoxyqueuosine reductase [Tepidibacter formicigenes DSM 15518]
MKKKLKDFCKSLGIENVGIAHIGPYKELEEILKDRINKGYYTGLEEEDIKKRVDPRITMENVKSIIVCLFPYFSGNVKKTNISKYTYSIDYHIIVKNKLENICSYLKDNINDFEYKIFVDTGPLVDRYLAKISGVGYFGINNNIITDKYGSYVSIGYILSNYPFEIDKPIDKTCIKCGLCIKKCPGGAILGNFEINPNKCLSFVTQKKGELSQEEKEMFIKNPSVFGCDICQDVCPHNKRVEVTNIEEFKNDLIYKLEYEEIKNISNREFKRRYGNRAFSWRGKSIILRNLEIINS